MQWILMAAVAGCGGGSDPTGTEGGGGTTPPPPTPAVATVDVTPTSATILVGATQALTATPRDAAGIAVSGATVSWSSSNAAVASVSTAGVVTGVSLGTATIKAASGGREGSVTFTVQAGGAMTSTGGTITSGNSKVSLTFPAGAVNAATTITVEPITDASGNEHLISGTTYEFGPDGTQFAQPVTLELAYDVAALPEGASRASLRVAKRVGNSWQPLTEDVVVDSVKGTVSASIRSFSSYAVVADPCVLRSLGGGTISGEITANDCLYEAADRRSDYYFFTAPAGEVITIETAGPLVGLMGIKEATTDPADGTVWLSTSIGNTMRLLSNGSPLQFFVSGEDAAQVGGYSITRTGATVEHSCSTATYMMPGTSFPQALTEANSCEETIQYSPYPEAIGKRLLAHYFGAKLVAGKSYTITVSGLSEAFDPGLTIFRSGVVAQAVGPLDGQTSRSVSVTPPTTGYYVIEVSTGRPDGESWVNPTGNYTLSVSQ